MMRSGFARTNRVTKPIDQSINQFNEKLYLLYSQNNQAFFL